MKKIIVSVSCLCFLIWISSALASKPVPVKITGCVKGGLLVSEQTDFGTHVSKGGYKIKTVNSKGTLVDLSRFEGKRINVPGNLLPGDRFVIHPQKIQVWGNCLSHPEKMGNVQKLRP